MKKIPKNKPVNCKVYKVVIPIFVPDNSDALVSTYASGTRQRAYEIGKTTLPIPKTKLFAFTTRQCARVYKKGNLGSVIYKANATGVYHNGWLQWIVGDDNKLVSIFSDSPPTDRVVCEPDSDMQSCCVCDSITLLEKIT